MSQNYRFDEKTFIGPIEKNVANNIQQKLPFIEA